MSFKNPVYLCSFSLDSINLKLVSKLKNYEINTKTLVKVEKEYKNDTIYGVKIIYVKNYSSSLLKLSEKIILNNDIDILNKFYNSIHEEINKKRLKRKFLCFVNPFGGFGDALKTFQNNTSKIFTAFDIDYLLEITDGPDFITDYFRDNDLSQYNSIISIGGDGLLNQILFNIYNTELSLNCINSLRNINLGIIPSGSTNATIYTLNGNEDARTAAIRIGLGETLPVDIGGIYSNVKPHYLLGCFISLCGYGFHGDIIENSENMRFLGPSRYDFAGLKNFFENIHYSGRLRMFQSIEISSNNWDSSSNKLEFANVLDLNKMKEILENLNNLENESENIKEVQGEFRAINAFNTSGKCKKAPNGVAPTIGHMEGLMDVIVVKRCTRFQFLRKLLYISKANFGSRNRDLPGHYRLPFVNVYRTRGFSFYPKMTDENSPVSGWCYDGELLNGRTGISCLIHPRLAEIYGGSDVSYFSKD